MVVEELVQWLRAQLDVDEQIAREATPGSWQNAPTARHHATASGRSEEAVFASPPDTGATIVAITGEAVERRHLVDAEHIVRHDPARVLREIDAMRKLIDLHKPIPDPAPPFRDADGFLCSVCTSGGTMYDQQRGVLFTDLTVFPCRTLRLLALPYAARLPGVLAPLAADQQSPQPSQKLRALLCPAGLPGGE